MALSDPEGPGLIARAILPCDDLGNAERLRIHASGRLLWIEAEGKWAAHDGKRWSVEAGQHEAERFAHMVARGMREEAFTIMSAKPEDLHGLAKIWLDDDFRKLQGKDLLGWAGKSSMADRTSGMLRQARRAQGMSVADLDAFDIDPLKMNLDNGVIKFIEVEPGRWKFKFRPGHDPSDMMMQMAGVAYDAGANCPHWRARFDLIQPDPEMQALLQRIYGSSLTGRTDSQTFTIHRGNGNDGKSMTHKIMVALLSRYARNAAADTFLEGPQQAGSAHRSDLARLSGDIRFVVFDEPQGKSPIWDTKVIKQFTGSTVTARGAYATDEKTFSPRCKLHGEMNIIPRARSDDHGMKRRLDIIPYHRQFGITEGMPDEPGTVVEARLRSELPGILNWLIEGALAWLPAPKMALPAPVRVAAATYWQGDNPMADWFGLYCDVSDPSALTWAGEMFESYRDWFMAEGHQTEDSEKQVKDKLGRWLKRMRNLDKRKSNGNWRYVSVRLRTAAEVLALEKERGDLSPEEPAPSTQAAADEDDGTGWAL